MLQNLHTLCVLGYLLSDQLKFMESGFVGGWNLTSVGNQEISASGNISMEEEFPYWQLAMAVRIIVVVFIFIPLIVFFSCSVFFAFVVKKDLHRPLNVVHMSLIVELLLVKLSFIITSFFVSPGIVRYCICPMWLEILYFSSSVFNIAFVNVMLTCLSILQLIYIKGKKQLVGWRVVLALVTGSTIYSILWGIGVELGLSLRTVHNFCVSLCDGIRLSLFNGYFFSIVTASFLVILPCLIIILIALLWSCFIFKKSYIGSDSQLNRRIISLPVIMPLVSILASVLFFIFRRLLQSILRLTATSHYPNFVLLSNEFLSYVLEGASAFIYPIVLLYIHPQLRSSWKAMLKELPGMIKRKCFGKKRSNVVHTERTMK